MNRVGYTGAMRYGSLSPVVEAVGVTSTAPVEWAIGDLWLLLFICILEPPEKHGQNYVDDNKHVCKNLGVTKCAARLVYWMTVLPPITRLWCWYT